MTTDHDPEQHSFNLRPASVNDPVDGRGHVLEVVHPAIGDGDSVAATMHGFNLAELADLHDQLGQYLDDMRDTAWDQKEAQQ